MPSIIVPNRSTILANERGAASQVYMRFFEALGESISGSTSGLQSQIDALVLRVTANESDIASINAAIAVINASILALQARVTVNEAAILALQIAVTTLETEAFSRISLAKTANYTILIADDSVQCDTTGGAFTVTLPTLSTAYKPVSVSKTNAGGAALTIDGNGAETINGAGSFDITMQYDSVWLVPHSTEWRAS